MNPDKNNNYLIAVNSGEKYHLIGNNSVYTEFIKDALPFQDLLSALLYIEKHGLEKLSRIVLKPSK